MRAPIGVVAAGALLLPAGALADFEQLMDDMAAKEQRLGFYAESARRCSTTLKISGLNFVEDSEDCRRILQNNDDLNALRLGFAALLDDLADHYMGELESLSARDQREFMRLVDDALDHQGDIQEVYDRVDFLLETR